jgi:protein gp37
MNKQGPGKIDYVDWSWNPVTGCLKKCSYCYANRVAWGRTKSLYLANPHVIAGDPADPFAPRWWPGRMDEPRKLKKPARIFVTDMGDLFGPWMSTPGIYDIGWATRVSVMETVKACPQHTFLFLTKFPENLPQEGWPENCWVGVTATRQRTMIGAVTHLSMIKAPVKFLSGEPLLGSWGDDLRMLMANLQGIDWVILGAQTKWPPKRTEWPWIMGVLEACARNGIPLWMKDNINDGWPDFPLKIKLKKELPVCRVCGCDNSHACHTHEGACHWVAPGLCSACVAKEVPKT